jgi:hypothetical protein
VNTVNRGIHGNLEIRTLCGMAQESFNSFCQIQVVPLGQLFGGKIVAALDRQHPRDLFDIKKMMEHQGYTEEIHSGFLFCLLSSKRPFHEILRPNFVDQKAVLRSQFNGMTDHEFSYELFDSTRSELVKMVNARLRIEDKELLKTFAEGNPKWPLKDLSIYPGVQWKLKNIKRFKQADTKKFNLQLKLLENVLDY